MVTWERTAIQNTLSMQYARCRAATSTSAPPWPTEQLADALVGGAGLERPARQKLSQRELQVFLRLAAGEAVGNIAEHMSLGIKTVSTYRARIMEKLGLASNSDLTYYALKNGLIQ